MKPMKRYLEPDQIKGRFFLLYFLYGKVKYGTRGSDMERLGRMSAYKAMMNLYRTLAIGEGRVLQIRIDTDVESLCNLARTTLPSGEFQNTFLSTISHLQREEAIA